MRCVITRVFPLPGPARISTGPSIVVTASRCGSLRPASKSCASVMMIFLLCYEVYYPVTQPEYCEEELFSARVEPIQAGNRFTPRQPIDFTAHRFPPSL